jgi:hypothetical protein
LLPLPKGVTVHGCGAGGEIYNFCGFEIKKGVNPCYQYLIDCISAVKWAEAEAEAKARLVEQKDRDKPETT